MAASEPAHEPLPSEFQPQCMQYMTIDTPQSPAFWERNNKINDALKALLNHPGMLVVAGLTARKLKPSWHL